MPGDYTDPEIWQTTKQKLRPRWIPQQTSPRLASLASSLFFNIEFIAAAQTCTAGHSLRAHVQHSRLYG